MSVGCDSFGRTCRPVRWHFGPRGSTSDHVQHRPSTVDLYTTNLGTHAIPPLRPTGPREAGGGVRGRAKSRFVPDLRSLMSETCSSDGQVLILVSRRVPFVLSEVTSRRNGLRPPSCRSDHLPPRYTMCISDARRRRMQLRLHHRLPGRARRRTPASLRDKLPPTSALARRTSKTSSPLCVASATSCSIIGLAKVVSIIM
jgi:hypothetical protein